MVCGERDMTASQVVRRLIREAAERIRAEREKAA